MKDADFIKILDTVVRLEVSKGHLRWKISDLSRLSGVQRTLVYYYFGKSKENILATALKTLGDDIFGLSPERLELWRTGRVRESIRKTRQFFKAAPHTLEFFFHWRHQPGEIQDHFKLQEKRFIGKLKDTYPKLKQTDLEALYTVFFALVVAPDLKDEVIDRVLEKMPIPLP